MREEVVAVQGQHWGLGVDSVLAGHEGWVYSVQWGPGQASLLTASMDKTMIVWQQMEDTQVSCDWSAAGHNNTHL